MIASSVISRVCLLLNAHVFIVSAYNLMIIISFGFYSLFKYDYLGVIVYVMSNKFPILGMHAHDSISTLIFVPFWFLHPEAIESCDIIACIICMLQDKMGTEDNLKLSFFWRTWFYTCLSSTFWGPRNN